MNALVAMWAVGLRHQVAYRAEVGLQLVSALMVAVLNASLWTAATSGREAVAGLTPEEMLTYVIVGWVGTTAVMTRVHEDVGERFRSGAIVTDLLRPMSFQAGLYAKDLGRACGALLVHSLPLFVVCQALFPLAWPSRTSTWGLWIGSVALAHLVNFSLSFLLGLAAIRVHHVTGLGYLKAALVSVFSGAMIPLALYTGALRTFVLALPFQAIAHAPASVFLGHGESAAFVVQLAWGVALWGLGALGWWWASRELAVQGG